ncbi:hypothetical protein MP228_007796 [Amoeboaphelidium protococcarum]|nr:hypothetical protein MP228_011878 [Amoeboaphelidium protococcarum]KAI3647575.1 hypothetical protein MP228_007796 [Amoeboaphelidium protococcarum]
MTVVNPASQSINSGNESMQQQQQQQQQSQQKMVEQEEQRHTILNSILSREAKERLNTLSLVKPQKAGAVQDLILRLARTKQIPFGQDGKVSEQTVRQLLEQIQQEGEQAETRQSSVVIQRRRALDSESEDEDYGF